MPSACASVIRTSGVVVLTQYAEPRYGLELLEAGTEGRGYLLKERVNDPRELHAAIEAVAHGGSVFDPAVVRLLVAGGSAGDGALDDLTPRERQVLGQMAQGKSNAAIAEHLVLTKKAVEKHVGSIFLKLGLPEEQVVSRRVAAVLLYLAAERVVVPGRRGVCPQRHWRARSIVSGDRPMQGSAHARGPHVPGVRACGRHESCHRTTTQRRHAPASCGAGAP